mgnify:FL=1
MKMKKLLSLALALVLIFSLAACSSSSSKGSNSATSTTSGSNSQTKLNYPVRSINNIIPFGAGGGTDVWNRALMDSMGSIMGQTIVSSNMTGGSAGSIGVQYVWDAGHDGYTLCGTSETPLTIPVMTNSELTSKDWKFFIAAGSPGVLCINKDSGMTTLADVVAAAQGDGSVSIAGTTGGLWFALAKLFDSYGNVPFKWIAYDGSSTAIKGCVSNEADLVVASAGEVVEYVRSGDLIPLCVMNTEEWEFPSYGTIPAVTSVVPELEAYLPLSQFLGFMVPADTDAAVLAYLEDVFHQAMQTDKIKQFAEEQICQIYDLTGDEASEFAAQLESKLCWVLYDMGQTTYSPEAFGIPQPGV